MPCAIAPDWGDRPPNPMSRQYLHAYLKAQELHKLIHRLTKAFEEDSTDEQILERLDQIDSKLQEIYEQLDDEPET